jgi:hypothetical protein
LKFQPKERKKGKMPDSSVIKKRFCFVCGVSLTDENDSCEHIIPRAIGGRRKIKGFLCAHCNNTTGHEWDARLADQLHDLGLICQIKRQGKVLPSKIIKTASGKKIQYNNDGSMTLGKPHYSAVENDDGTVRIQIQARTKDEARKMLEGVARKYPGKFDVEEWLSNFDQLPVYTEDPLCFSLDLKGDEHGRSVVKSALALAVEAGVNACSCETARDYLLNNGEPCYGYYTEKDLVRDRPKGVPLHCVAICGDPQSQLLLGYAELYSVYRIVMCLSRTYEGKALQHIYAIDPSDGSSLDLKVDLMFLSDNLPEIFKAEYFDFNAVKENLDAVLARAVIRAQKVAQSDAIEQAFKRALLKCGVGENEVLDIERCNEFSSTFVEGLMPYLMHLGVGRNKRKER